MLELLEPFEGFKGIGKITYYNETRRFGFIDGKIFFHYNNGRDYDLDIFNDIVLIDKKKHPKRGDEVLYCVTENRKGIQALVWIPLSLEKYERKLHDRNTRRNDASSGH